MNRSFFIAIIAVTTLSFTSCGTYNSARDSHRASAVSKSSLLGKVGTMLVKDLTSKILPQNTGANLLGKLNMGTKLNTIIQGATLVNKFKGLLTNNYGITSGKVNNAYSKFSTIKDVALFIAQNSSPSFLSKL